MPPSLWEVQSSLVLRPARSFRSWVTRTPWTEGATSPCRLGLPVPGGLSTRKAMSGAAGPLCLLDLRCCSKLSSKWLCSVQRSGHLPPRIEHC
eukprot:8841898-Heterocapsa_arctica.AAC.1